jgi:translocation and assembly module TamB
MRLTTKGKALFLHGSLHATRAVLEVASKSFHVSKADIDFMGPLVDSKLHIIASNEVGPVITQILIRGSIESPKIDFQSVPTLSQKEVLSWIFFSKSSTEISPLEGIQLAQILLKLQGNSAQNIDVFEKIKNTLRIDRIDVNSSNRSVPSNSLGNEVSVQVGKYISDGLVLTLSKDVTNEANRIGIEANLAKHITATANVGDDAQTQLSIEWKVNY